MARKNTGEPAGRPEKPIDWKIFEDLCHIQCTQSELASFFRINVDTLHDRVVKNYGDSFSEVYKRYSDGGKSSLRRQQFKLAEKNAAMGIWLGKQWLSQKDNEEKTVPIPPYDERNNQYILIAKQQNELAELKGKLDQLQPQTSSVDITSNTQI